MKKLLIGLMLVLGSIGFAQERFEYTFTIADSTAGATDSVWVPDGFSPVSITSTNCVTPTTVNLQIAEGTKATRNSESDVLNTGWSFVGAAGDTAYYAIPIAVNSDVTVPLDPLVTHVIIGEGYPLYGPGYFIKLYINTLQDNVVAAFKVLFRKL